MRNSGEGLTTESEQFKGPIRWFFPVASNKFAALESEEEEDEEEE